jgi:LysR family glycine cleavage system transcriptional activator
MTSHSGAGRRESRRKRAVARPRGGLEPPFNALRVFNAAGQHLSFTKAARELKVTQAAVSHQIATLEDFLGVHLFRRSGRGVVLTAEGMSYLIAVREALAHLEQATTRLRAGRGEASVVCSIATTIAMRWLVPNLHIFNLLNPRIEIRLSLTERYVDFDRENVDIAIRYGDGRWPGLVSDLLFREVIVPVCSPDFLRRRRLARPEDLHLHTLLHASTSLKDWACWLAAQQVAGIDTKGGLTFEQPHLVLEAAADGLGVAMADRWLVRADLAAGRLTIPFDGALIRSDGYFVVGRDAARKSLHVGAFWQWLIAQASDGMTSDTVPTGDLH